MSRSLRKVAEAVYQRLLDASPDGHVDIEDVRAEVARELRVGGDIADDAIDEIAANAVEQVDRRLAQRGESQQMSLLSGEDEALDGVWRLGDGRRARVRHATRDDYTKRMAIKSDNLAAVERAHAADLTEYSKLLPYFETAATTVEEAIEAWRADNEDGE